MCVVSHKYFQAVSRLYIELSPTRVSLQWQAPESTVTSAPAYSIQHTGYVSKLKFSMLHEDGKTTRLRPGTPPRSPVAWYPGCRGSAVRNRKVQGLWPTLVEKYHSGFLLPSGSCVCIDSTVVCVWSCVVMQDMCSSLQRLLLGLMR